MKNKRLNTTAQHTETGSPVISNTSPHSMPSALSELQNTPIPEEFYTASGPLHFKMTNDALFHIVFEANHRALKGFLCSLLRLTPEEISSVEVTNPIDLGNSIYSKNFVLDLKLLLNSKVVINLEMQVENLSFWKDRSLCYLCRSFDNLNKGDSYLKIKPAIHIGILNFDLFPETPEFYANYHLSNDVTHKKYSDNFRLSVLQLKHTELATEEDRHWGLDLWAKFFNADSWEVIHMLAQKNPYIADAAQTVYHVSEDDRIRAMCEAREEGEKTQRTIHLLHQMEQERSKQELQQMHDNLQQANQRLQQQDRTIQSIKEENARLLAELKALKESQNS